MAAIQRLSALRVINLYSAISKAMIVLIGLIRPVGSRMKKERELFKKPSTESKEGVLFCVRADTLKEW